AAAPNNPRDRNHASWITHLGHLRRQDRMSPGRHATALAAFVDLEPRSDGFREAVLSGLSWPQKQIPAKFLYDETGSRLFERICKLPEYYPTRTELAILSEKRP